MDHSTHKNTVCWYEIPMEIPKSCKDWLDANVPVDQRAPTDPPHITVLYGFDCKYYDEIEAAVKEQKFTKEDFKFGEVLKWTVKSGGKLYVVAVHSEKLQKLFWKLHGKYTNQHTLTDGKYVPHVTLTWLKKDDKA